MLCLGLARELWELARKFPSRTSRADWSSFNLKNGRAGEGCCTQEYKRNSNDSRRRKGRKLEIRTREKKDGNSKEEVWPLQRTALLKDQHDAGRAAVLIGL